MQRSYLLVAITRVEFIDEKFAATPVNQIYELLSGKA